MGSRYSLWREKANNNSNSNNYMSIFGSVSYDAFRGIGKRKWLNIAKGNEEYCKALGLEKVFK